MLDINALNSQTNELREQIASIRIEVENEIHRVTEYLNSLTNDINVFECEDCGCEICWSEYDENGGYCNRCNDC